MLENCRELQGRERLSSAALTCTTETCASVTVKLESERHARALRNLRLGVVLPGDLARVALHRRSKAKSAEGIGSGS